MTSVRAGLQGMRFSVVGPGRVGSTLALWLTAHGARLETVAAREPWAASRLAERAGGRSGDLRRLKTEGNDLLLLTVADAALPEVAERLARRPQARHVLHVSGAVTVEALAPLRVGGSSVGGLHPLRAFTGPGSDLRDPAGVVFAVGGDAAAVRLAETIVATWRGVAIRLEDGHRPLYHLAASLAAGGVVTLLAIVESIVRAGGIDEAFVDGYYALARQALDQAAAAPGAADAITGPAARGDVDTVERHLTALTAAVPEAAVPVAALAAETVRQRMASDDPPQDSSELLEILSKVMQRKSFLDP